jgi:hypothetical protein
MSVTGGCAMSGEEMVPPLISPGVAMSIGCVAAGVFDKAIVAVTVLLGETTTLVCPDARERPAAETVRAISTVP